MMDCQEHNKIPLLISIDMLKDALKTLPIDDLRAIKRLIDEILKEFEIE